MTCKDCVYCERCISLISHGMGYDEVTGKYLTDIDTRCISFKSKEDYVEVKHGEWIKKPYISKQYKQCPVCKYDFSRLEPDNYCPNCGAKMDKKAGAEQCLNG